MVAGIAFCNGGDTEVQAGDASKTETTTLRPITFADFNLADNTYTGQTGGAYYATGEKKAETLLTDVMFSGYVTLNDAGETTQQMQLNFGYTDGWYGLSFKFSADGKTMEVNTGNVGGNGFPFKYSAGGNFSFKNNRFKLSFSLECRNLDNQVVDENSGVAPENDLLMKVYINDELRTAYNVTNAETHGSNGAYYICNMNTTYLKGYIRNQYVGATEGYYDSITVESCELPYNNTATFADYGLSDQTFSTQATYRTGTFVGSMISTQLKGRMMLSGSGTYMLNYGSTATVKEGDREWYISGLRIQIKSSGQFWFIPGTRLGGSYLNEPDASGDNSQSYASGMPIGKEFDISFNTIPWDWDGDGAATDGKIEIRINDKLLQNHYVIIKDMCSESVSLVNRFSMLAAGNFTTGTTAIAIESEVQDVSRLRKVELEDFGLANGECIKQVHNSVGPTTLLNTLMEVDLSVEESISGSQLHYAVPLDKGGWYGTKFTILNNAITVANTDGSITGGTINASEINRTTFFGDSFKFGLSLEKMDFHGDGQNNDARLGVWIDGKLLRNYYYVDKVNEVGTGMSVFSYLTAEEQYANTVTITDVKEEASQFATRLGLSDVNASGVTAGVYGYNSGNPEEATMHPKTTAEKAGSLDGAMFSTNVRFSKESIKLFYGCPAERLMGWHCIRIGSDGNASQTFSVDYAGRKIATLHAGVAGVKLYENTYKLSISTKYVDSDGDDLFDDLEVGVWFNDVLYNNTYFYVDSITSELNPNIAVYSVEDPGQDGYIVLGNYTQETATEVTHCADKFAYFADGTVVTVDGNTIGTSWNTAKPGEYQVTYTNETTMGTSTFKEHVLVYKTNDVTADGMVTVVDLVAMKKLAAGERADTSNAGKKAVGYAESSEWYTTEVQNNMFAQLLADENTIRAKVMSNEILGETGSLNPSGNKTYITSLGATKEGTSVIGISDNVDVASRNYTTNVSVFDNSGLDFVLDFDTDREIKVLQITDTQIIDSNQRRTKGKEPDNRLSASSITAYATDQMGTLLYDELDALIVKERPDLILMTGDNVYGEFDDAGTSLQTLIEKMDGYKIPWAPVFGNHDNETALGVSWQCQQFMESDYCMFNRRNEIGGNGNYSIGIAVKGKIQRTIFMMDTNGCANISGVANQADKDAITTNFIFHDEQIAWFQSTAAKVRTHSNAEIPSFLCVHVPLAEVTTALMEQGYQLKADSKYLDAEKKEVPISHNYTIGNVVLDDTNSAWKYEKDTNGNFGFKEGKAVGTSAMSEYILPYLKAAGTDGTFFGHQHVNSLSVEWEGIRFTYGLKTGRYDESPNQTGGTVITLSGSNFDVNHSIINNLDI